MRRLLAFRPVAVVVFAAAVAGCSSSSSGGTGSNTADTTPPTTSSSSPTSSPSASSSPKPTPSYSSTVQASVHCTAADLGMALGQEQGAAGSTIVPIVFTNTSSTPCTLFGYPGVSFLDASHKQIGLPAARRGGQEATVTLGPGDEANAQLSIPNPGNFSPSDCNVENSSFLLVYPPGETHSLEVSESTQVCSTAAGRSVVLPVAPGSGS